LQGLRSADLVILVLGDRYGELQPSGLSATQMVDKALAHHSPDNVEAAYRRTDFSIVAGG
jgi:hypothetical protein